MKNKIKSLVGALALAGAVNATDTNEVKFVEGPVEYAGKTKLTALFPAGHTNKYTLQSTTNLVSGAWEDSATNTNIYNQFKDYGITNASVKIGLYEPKTDVKQRFYRLKLN